MINGVLVERTVGDVLPQLQSNADNMNKVLVELAKQYKTKQDDMEKWKVRPKFLYPPHSRRASRQNGVMLIVM
jgi:prefoldin subunit 2